MICAAWASEMWLETSGRFLVAARDVAEGWMSLAMLGTFSIPVSEISAGIGCVWWDVSVCSRPD